MADDERDGVHRQQGTQRRERRPVEAAGQERRYASGAATATQKPTARTGVRTALGVIRSASQRSGDCSGRAMRSSWEGDALDIRDT